MSAGNGLPPSSHIEEGSVGFGFELDSVVAVDAVVDGAVDGLGGKDVEEAEGAGELGACAGGFAGCAACMVRPSVTLRLVTSACNWRRSPSI